MAGGALSLTEPELHGLVDGRLEASRRADVLRRLALSSPDRALVEAWQEQAELIRSAFRDVEREPLPVVLDLAPPRLRCIDTAVPRPDVQAIQATDPRKSRVAATMTVLVVAAGLFGAWLMVAQVGRGDASGLAEQRPTLETTPVERPTASVDSDTIRQAERAAPEPSGSFTVRVPDLRGAGFTLTSVSADPTEPTTMVMRFTDKADQRLAVSVIRHAEGLKPTAPAIIGKSIAWREHYAAFAMSGTLPTDQLRAIAETLQDDTGR